MVRDDEETRENEADRGEGDEWPGGGEIGKVDEMTEDGEDAGKEREIVGDEKKDV